MWEQKVGLMNLYLIIYNNIYVLLPSIHWFSSPATYSARRCLLTFDAPQTAASWVDPGKFALTLVIRPFESQLCKINKIRKN